MLTGWVFFPIMWLIIDQKYFAGRLDGKYGNALAGAVSGTDLFKRYLLVYLCMFL